MFEEQRDSFLRNSNLERMELKAVMFDMDGVLFDSMPNHAKAWHEAMKIHGLDLSQEEAYMHEGRTGEGTINIVSLRERGHEATEEEIQKIYDTKREIFQTLPTAMPMRGARELLEKVKSDGITPILVTGSGTKSLLERLERNFPDIFTEDRMVTGFDVKYGKPHPEPYLMGMKKGHVMPHEVIVVENAPLGIRSAKAAGCLTVAVNTGPLPDECLLEEGADILFHSIEEFYQYWDEIRKVLS